MTKKKPRKERNASGASEDGRRDLSALVAFVGEKLRQGMLQKDIAPLIGKSQAYVSNLAKLAALPPMVAKAVDSGSLSDIISIINLAKAEKRDPESVERFLSEETVLTRSAVRRFLRQLGMSGSAVPPARAASAFPRWERGKVAVEHAGRWAVIVLEKKPRNEKHAWIRYSDGQEAEVPVAKLVIRAVVAG